MNSNTGGPAFPSTEWQKNKAFPSQPMPVAVGGMTLRDYFAAEIMGAFLHGAVLPPGFDASEQLLFAAGRAYEAADAMLKAREATP